MIRYVGIFFASIFMVGVSFMVLPLFIWRFTSDIDFASYIGAALVLLISFVIAQLFYIIDLLKTRNEFKSD